MLISVMIFKMHIHTHLTYYILLLLFPCYPIYINNNIRLRVDQAVNVVLLDDVVGTVAAVVVVRGHRMDPCVVLDVVLTAVSGTRVDLCVVLNTHVTLYMSFEMERMSPKQILVAFTRITAL